MTSAATRKRERASVLICHHSGHSAKDRARGSYALKAALDFEYRIELREDTALVSNLKTKDGEPPAPLGLRAHRVELSMVTEAREPMHSLVPLPSDPPERANTDGLGDVQSRMLEELRAMDAEHRGNLEQGGHDPVARGANDKIQLLLALIAPAPVPHLEGDKRRCGEREQDQSHELKVVHALNPSRWSATTKA